MQSSRATKRTPHGFAAPAPHSAKRTRGAGMDAWLGMEEADILRYTSFGIIAAGVLAAVLLQVRV